MAFLAYTQWKLHCRHSAASVRKTVKTDLLYWWSKQASGFFFFFLSKLRSSHKTQNDCHRRLAKGQITTNLMSCDYYSTCYTSDWVQQSLWIDLSEKPPIIPFCFLCSYLCRLAWNIRGANSVVSASIYYVRQTHLYFCDRRHYRSNQVQCPNLNLLG